MSKKDSRDLNENIVIRGARANNLKNINITIPRNKLVVFTGLSGSGKSSLAFDTIYAEGQRRYVESLSAYARQFLGQADKPDVDSISGLSPAIAIDQKSTSNNPRSTVGTITEINDYFRLLYANIGKPHCPKCGKPIEQMSVDQVVDSVKALGEGKKIRIIAPAVRARKGEFEKLFEKIRKDGFVRVEVDGILYDINEVPALDKQKKHTIDIIVDRIIIKNDIDSRLSSSLETAFTYGHGLCKIDVVGEGEKLYSQNYSCIDCDISLPELTPRMFSFNNPYGACEHCAGLGQLLTIDSDIIVPDKSLSLNQGAIKASGWQSINEGGVAVMYFKALAKHYGFSMDTPWCEISKEAQNAILYGTGSTKIKVTYEKEYGSGTFTASFEGVVNNLQRRYRDTQSESIKQELERYMSHVACPECKGKRLKKESLAVKVGGLSIAEVSDKNIGKIQEFIDSLVLTEKEQKISMLILKEIRSRLGFLMNVGLDYLTLSRSASSLSGGEAQRIRLATQIGSGLVGVLYVLDEPSIGLHQKDNEKLIKTLQTLRDLGNTLIVVEHDEETMLAADRIVDIGPGAGEHGGYIVAEGTVEEVSKCKESITGQFLSGRRKIEVPKERRPISDKKLIIHGAKANNLKNIDVEIPLGVFTCVTGVSGSGKSSLINEVLKKRLLHDLNRAHTTGGKCDYIEGISHLDKVIDIDQSPIGRTPRSNPATYTGLFDLVREVFAMTPDAKMRGYTGGRFSFNVKGGRCEACRGDGIIKIEMHFLPDVYVPCDVCAGKRYNRETLEVKYKGKTIADVLDMTVEEALEFFAPLPRLKSKLQTLYDVGLGYIKLGQPSTTLSGGEAQRVKLATELSRRDTGRTVYILDEPTTGLHSADVERLLEILKRLVNSGSTVITIEHNLDVIKTADYIIDMGPDGGDKGGTVVACGTPEEVAQNKNSYTGACLKKILQQK